MAILYEPRARPDTIDAYPFLPAGPVTAGDMGRENSRLSPQEDDEPSGS